MCPWQDAEKRILNGKSAMGNGKILTICHRPFPISDQAGFFQRPAGGSPNRMESWLCRSQV
jgi:hypothetical protein